MMGRKLLVMLVVGLLLVTVASTLAQNNEIEMIGAIEAVNTDGSIVVNGQLVLLTGAEVNTPLTVGTVVKVEGRFSPNGIIAREVQAPNADDLQDDEIEITGLVDAVGNNTITIGGFVIDLTGAEITGVIAVGEVVKVHVSTDANGAFVAREAEVVVDDVTGSVPPPAATEEPGSVPPPAATEEPGFNDDNPRAGEFEIVGTLQEIGTGFIVVNGQTIQFTGAEIKNQLVVGALVKIHLRNNGGTLVAREVENANRDDDDRGRDDDRSDDRPWNVMYTIRPGDTLSDIANRAGTTVEAIARVNNIADIRVVIVGTNLLLPNIPFQFDDDDDNSGRGSSNSGRGNNNDDDDDGNSNSGSGNSNDDDDDGNSNSGPGNNNDDDDDD